MKKRRKPELQFAVCIDNKGYKASLEIGKLYRIIADEEAAAHGYLRVIGEGGEDYGYSANRFFPIELPQELEKALQVASQESSTTRPNADCGTRSRFRPNTSIA